MPAVRPEPRHAHAGFRLISSCRITRDVTVYLPPGYDDRATRATRCSTCTTGRTCSIRQPAFKKGEHWRVGETATALIDAGRIEPLIIVGIDNTGARRLHEYTPTRTIVAAAAATPTPTAGC